MSAEVQARRARRTMSERRLASSLGAIADVDAQHAAVLRMAAGRSPVDDAFGDSVMLRELRRAVDRRVSGRASEAEG